MPLPTPDTMLVAILDFMVIPRIDITYHARVGLYVAAVSSSKDVGVCLNCVDWFIFRRQNTMRDRDAFSIGCIHRPVKKFSSFVSAAHELQMTNPG